jgi:acyl carrier protein
MKRDDVLQDIYAALARANELREPAEQLACAEETTLYGPNGGLDSLGLVSLILDVEQAVDDRTGVQLVLADEHAMSQRRNPFRDVRSMADYVLARLEEHCSCATGR